MESRGRHGLSVFARRLLGLFRVVGWTAPTPTTPSNGINTPMPIQTGMTKSCNKFHTVKSTTTCASIQDYYKVSFADFHA